LQNSINLLKLGTEIKVFIYLRKIKFKIFGQWLLVFRKHKIYRNILSITVAFKLQTTILTHIL